jgi:NAD(P)-dependent dehydrogenase (short-subunit alcohol dehydrogenase family)
VLLEGRNAIVYGGGGAIGGAIASAFAAEGARVHLAGRTTQTLGRVADQIRAAGGAVEATALDALDEAAVEAYANAVAAGAGTIDISINTISLGETFGLPLAEIGLAEFERPVHTAVRSNFLTARAAARHMIRQGSGVILTFGGYGDPLSDFYLGGFQVGLSAVDALRRQLAAELGRHGIRVLTIQSAGVPETIAEESEDRVAVEESIVTRTMLRRAATLTDVGNAAVFAASDYSAAMTATSLNLTCGAEVD